MNNPVLTSGILSWLAAQIIKTLLHAVKSDKLVLERFVGAGGMPSSHTAMVLGTLITTGRLEGTDSALFGVAFVFSAVVIYDAMNVRRAAGLHAMELNAINKLFNFRNIKHDTEDDEKKQKELNEFLGHTPLEVLGGAVVGTIVSLLIPIK